MPDYISRVHHQPQWLDQVKTQGKTALKHLVFFSAIATLTACGGTSVTSSTASFNRNLFAKSSFVAPKSLTTSIQAAPDSASVPLATTVDNQVAPEVDTLVAGSDKVEGQSDIYENAEMNQAASDQIEFLEPADLETNILAGVIAEAPGLINLALCTKGLSGELVTTRAGYNLLAVNGLGEGDEGLPVSDLPILAASALAADPAPSAGMVEPAVVPAVASLSASAVSTTEALLISAYQQTGRHYKEGGQTPAAGFDAAGFTRWVYGQRGINLPKDIKRQVAGGRQVAKEDLRPGDLMVYRDAGQNGDSYHVGIYTGQGNFLHAVAKSGVVTETAAFGPQYAPFFVGGRRYYDDPNAAPLSDGQKMAAASSAVKVALAELGPNDKPDRKVRKRTTKAKTKAKTTRKK